MAEKHCLHLVLGKHETRRDYYTCDISGKVCVASTFGNADFGHPASVEFADYHDYDAKECPCYDLPEGLVGKIRKHWKD